MHSVPMRNAVSPPLLRPGSLQPPPFRPLRRSFPLKQRLTGPQELERGVLASAESRSGRNRLASKLFDTYKDQMATKDEDEGTEDTADDITSAAVSTATRRSGSGRSKQTARSGKAGKTTRQPPAAVAAYTVGKQEDELKRSKYFYKREDGSLRPVTGVHGAGEVHWWALRVTVGREKQTCTNIERRWQQLREAAELEGTAHLMQEIETWDVWKRVRAWSPKTEKMGNKMVRYEGGGWVLVRAILTEDIASIIKGNINILGYHNREVFDGEEFPIPADGELLSALTAWQEDMSEITEDAVREELGLGPKREVLDYFDDFEDYGRRGRGRDRDGRDGRSGGNRDSDRRDRSDRIDRNDRNDRRGGLFSSSQSADDGWDDDMSSWYGGSGEDEGLLLDTFDESIGFGSSAENADDDTMDAFGAWLGDFGAGAGDGGNGGDWMSATMDTPVESTQRWQEEDMNDSRNDRSERGKSAWSSSSNDDLSWWDDDENDDNAGGLFTDDEPLTASSFSLSEDEVEDKVEDGTEHTGAESRIAVVAGEFKDFEGRVLREDGGEGVLKVEVDVFGLPTVVELPREDVEFL